MRKAIKLMFAFSGKTICEIAVSNQYKTKTTKTVCHFKEVFSKLHLVGTGTVNVTLVLPYPGALLRRHDTDDIATKMYRPI